MSDSASEGQEHIGGEKIPIQTNSYEQLENQLGTIWGSNSGKRKLLFSGVEIKFHPSSGMESSFIIEGSEKYAHPILFEEEITLRHAGEGDNKIQKARILPTRKDGSIKKRPVLSGEQLILQFGSNRKLLPGTVEVINVSDYPINEWIKRLSSQKVTKCCTEYCFLVFSYEQWHFRAFGWNRHQYERQM